MLRQTLLFLSEREDLKDVLFHLPFARRAAERFVAGETSDEALRAAAALNADGFSVTLDLLGESVSDREAAERAARAYEESLADIAESAANATISLKLTQLGLDIDPEFCLQNLLRIVERASRLGNFVRIDMEGSRHTEATLGLFQRAFEKHRNLGVVIQSYLRRSEEDVRRLVSVGAPVRLCKGAYSEPGSVAFQSREEVDANYVRLMRMLLDGGAPTAIATHDERMIEVTRAHARARGLSEEAFEFQMLYGVRRDYQRRLVKDGYRMRIYVPYGSQWYSYLMRRMAERPANLWFVLRASLGD